jgi:hypothetical protein
LGGFGKKRTRKGRFPAPTGALVTGISPRVVLRTEKTRDTADDRFPPDRGNPTNGGADLPVRERTADAPQTAGKTKTKPRPVKEDVVLDDDPDAMLHNLVSLAYIDESEAKRIRTKKTGSSPTGTE